MALVSPGVEVTIIDESQYTSAGQNTIPYILIATGQDKLTPAGTSIAPGTTASTLGDVFLITSQRELVNTFGNPEFYKTAGGDAIHGYELNEYGLMAAYSVLGATNRAYVQRVDVDLTELEAALTRPTGAPNAGTYWFDLVESKFGFFVWNSTTNAFTNIVPLIITDVADLVGGVASGIPLASIGQIGTYAVNTTNANNPLYYKNSSNAWVLVGSDAWKASIPSVVGTSSDATLVSTPILVGETLTIQLGAALETVTFAGGEDLAGVVTAIETVLNDVGSTIALTEADPDSTNDRLEFYRTPFDPDSAIILGGTALTKLGITAGSYYAPIMTHATHIDVPRWRASDTTPRPSGSMWQKTTAVNEGADIVIKRYDSATSAFVEQSAPLYPNDWTANKNLDPGTGGASIDGGATYVQYDLSEDSTATFKIFTRTAGITTVTGNLDPAHAGGETFNISASATNSDVLTGPTLITISGTSNADIAADINAAGIANVEAGVTANNYLTITHTGGGVIVLDDIGGALAAAGITDTLENIRTDVNGDLIVSNWNVTTLTADVTEPGQDPVNGTRWYYPAIDEIDILIHDAGDWKSYRTVSADLRGHDLTATDPAGPIVSATAPEEQSVQALFPCVQVWPSASTARVDGKQEAVQFA